MAHILSGCKIKPPRKVQVAPRQGLRAGEKKETATTSENNINPDCKGGKKATNHSNNKNQSAMWEMKVDLGGRLKFPQNPEAEHGTVV